MKHVLGIDPGLSGALCLLSPAPVILDMPTIERTVNGRKKRQIDAHQVARWLDVYREIVARAVIEQVGAMPSQGVTSSFNFGFTTGVLHGCLASAGIPMTLVVPAVWKRHFGLLGQDKDASRQAASRIAPAASSWWPLKKHDGRAEAFLLATWGKEKA